MNLVIDQSNYRIYIEYSLMRAILGNAWFLQLEGWDLNWESEVMGMAYLQNTEFNCYTILSQ